MRNTGKHAVHLHRQRLLLQVLRTEAPSLTPIGRLTVSSDLLSTGRLRGFLSRSDLTNALT